jgi:uncharacterized protein
LIVTTPPETWAVAIQQFNDREFFACHETLEHLWLQTENPDEKLLYQGLLQIAVGFLHWQRGNFHGAQKKLNSGVAKLQLIQQPAVFASWLELNTVIAESLHVLSMLQAADSDQMMVVLDQALFVIQ